MTERELSRTKKKNELPFLSQTDKSPIARAGLGEQTTAILLLLFQRLAFGAVVLLAIIFLSYLGLDMARGTPFGPAVQQALPEGAAYVGRLLRGDLGLTQAGSDTLLPLPVTQVIAERLPRSLGLLGISLIFASVVGISLGTLAARGRSHQSLGILLSTVIGISIPSFFAAFLLQWAVTSYTRHAGQSILPVGGFGWDRHLILPIIVLAARPIAQITRISFISIKDALRQDYVRTARSKGLYRAQIMAFHVMRNAAVPVLTTIGVSLRFSLSSLPVVELYFGWPGVGLALLKGIAQRDNNLTIALALCLGALFILVNLILDLSYRLIDPRLLETPAHIGSGEKRKLVEALRVALVDLLGFLNDNALINWFKRRGANPASSPFQAVLARTGVQVGEAEKDISPGGGRAAWAAVPRNFPLVVGGVMALVLVTLVFLGPELAPHNPYTTQGLARIDGKLVIPPFAPDETYSWGTDALGRDIMSLVLAGAQLTIGLALLAVAARMGVGVLLGAIAGWSSGGRLDRFISGVAEIISAFPTLLLTMILILALGIRQGVRPFVIALCFVGWGEIMQFVRGEVMVIRPRPFIESAVAVGARTPRIIGRHMLPNLLPALISLAALEMGAVLMLLGELGFISIFIGGGAFAELDVVSAPYHYSDVPEWGALLSNIRIYARSHPWTALYPTLAFFLAILSFNLFGEGVRRLVEEGSLIIAHLVNRYTVALAVVGMIGLSWLRANSGPMTLYRQQAQAFDGERALAHVTALANPAWNGRALGTPGLDAAAQYIATEFEALGLQPAGEKLTYFQQRSRAFERLETIPTFAIEDKGPFPVYGRDYAAYPGYYLTMGEMSGPVRVIGLGQVAPGVGGGIRPSFPALRRADFSDEILLALSARDARILAQEVPFGGLLVLADDPGDLQRRFTLSGRTAVEVNAFTGKEEGADTPSLWITEETANRLLAKTGRSVADLRQQVADLGVEELFELPTLTRASMSVEGSREGRWLVQNVIGHLPGAAGVANEGQLDQQLIVVLAQYDSPPPGPEEEIYQAVNDNASGVAVMLEAIRVMQESDYRPHKTFLFVAYSGEGLEGGEVVSNPDVIRFLQAKTGFANAFELEAVVHLRGLGGGTGDRLEVSAGGSLRLAELFETAARRMGVNAGRADEAIDISIIYEEGSRFQSGQEAPEVRLFWEGWDANSRLPTDDLAHISADNLEEAGRALALALMILGRETQY